METENFGTCSDTFWFFLLTPMPEKRKAAADASDIDELDIIKEQHNENKPWDDVIRDEIVPEALAKNPGGAHGFNTYGLT
jgi:hypothetical protein